MMERRPLILVSNDDSIMAPGLRMLIRIMNELGDVVVVAPDTPQSGMSHAVTIQTPLFVVRRKIDNGPQIEYSCSGTPADCVKIAKANILERKPDLCVSGINHGSNSSINVIYSGTMAAAIEAGLADIPSIGFSLLSHSLDADFLQSAHYVKTIAKEVLEKGLDKGVVLNVNIPDIKKEEIRGVKICRQTKSRWVETFEKRQSPLGREYYWFSGDFTIDEQSQDTDQWALDNNYISVVPVYPDLTHYKSIEKLKTFEFDGNK